MNSIDYNRRFGGVAKLYPGSMDIFRNAHVAVIGLGGVGSWAVEALARTAIGHITLIDLDNIAESNINRQLHAINDNIGKPKTQAMRERILSINPHCIVHEIEDFLTEENLDLLIGNHLLNFVIDAIDQTRIKTALAAYCVKNKVPLAISGAAGGKIMPQLIKIDDLRDVKGDRLLANMRYTLRKKYEFSKDLRKKMNISCVYSEESVSHPNSSCAPHGLSCSGYGSAVTVTATFGFYLASIALNYLAQQNG